MSVRAIRLSVYSRSFGSENFLLLLTTALFSLPVTATHHHCGPQFLGLLGRTTVEHEKIRDSFPRQNDAKPESGRPPTAEERDLFDKELAKLRKLFEDTGLQLPKDVNLRITDHYSAYDPETNTVFLHYVYDSQTRKMVLDPETIAHEFGHVVLHTNASELAKTYPGMDELFAETISCLSNGHSYVANLNPASWNSTDHHEFLAPTICHLGRWYLQNLSTQQQRV